MYGQQFANPIASAAKWMFFGFAGIVLMAILLGGNLKDATWLNPGIAAAQAEKTRMEVAHQQEMNKLQEQLTAAQTDAQIREIQRKQEMLDAQYEHDKQILAQDVVNKQRVADTVINLVIFVGTTTGIVATISALIIAIAKAIAILRSTPKNQPTVTPSRSSSTSQPTLLPSPSLPTIQIIKPVPEREPHNLSESPVQMHERRLAERLKEINSRKNELDMIARLKAAANPASISKEQRDNLPLAM